MTSRIALVNWYREREGKISYSDSERKGPDSYDSGAALFAALIAGNFLPKMTPLGSLSILIKLERVLLIPISEEEALFGDIFITGFEENELSSDAYGGVIISRTTIISCNAAAKGIARTKLPVGFRQRTRWYRLAEPTRPAFYPLRSGRQISVYASRNYC